MYIKHDREYAVCVCAREKVVSVKFLSIVIWNEHSS